MKKTIEELNLMDDFLFQEVLSDREYGVFAARLLLSAIMGCPIGEVTVHTQKVITPGDTDRHGIRLDVYMEEKPDGRNEGFVIYDVEVQKEDTHDLPGRSRYYQALMDSRMLNTSEPYKDLKKLWIIIIMPVDIFGQGRMCYTFENRCVEESGLALGDGAKRLFLYCGGKDSNRKELGELLCYIADSRSENAVNEKVRELHEVVDKVKHKHEVGVRYMKAIEYENMIREEGREEGLEKGIRNMIAVLRELEVKEEVIVQKLKEKYRLSEEEIKNYLNCSG